MVLGKLIDYYNNGALKLQREKGANFGYIGELRLSEEDAFKMCKSLGWDEINLSPLEIISKTEKFVKSFKANFKVSTELLYDIDVKFQNLRDVSYGKTCDRIVLESKRGMKYVILYGMKNAKGTYVVYKGSRTIEEGKFRSLKAVAEYIVGDLDNDKVRVIEPVSL